MPLAETFASTFTSVALTSASGPASRVGPVPLLAVRACGRKELLADYHAIVLAEESAAAQQAYASFVKKWSKSYPEAVTSL